jgi:hypothetical protein
MMRAWNGCATRRKRVGKGRVKLEAKHQWKVVFSPVELAIHLQQQTRARSSLRSFAIFPSARRRVELSPRATRRWLVKSSRQISVDDEPFRDALKRRFWQFEPASATPISTNGSLCRVHETSGRLFMSHISDVLDITL